MSKTHTLLEDLGPKAIRLITEHLRLIKIDPSGGSSSNLPANPLPVKYSDKLLPVKYSGSGRSSNTPHRGSIGKYLLGLGALGAAGAGAYALRDKLGDAADEAGEHINSLRDKLANIIAARHEA
jgi:hypothetical protein